VAAKAVRVIGPGRAGRSFARGLEKAGWRVAGVLGRDDDVTAAAEGVDLLVLAVPDGAVAAVAAAVRPVPACVVAHLAGALGLDVLAPHERRASVHPLRSLPTPTSDLAGAWFAVAGDALAAEVVADLDGRVVAVDDAARTAYHAAAVIASNHLVALLGSVERVAATAGVPLDAFLDLVRGTVDNVELLGPAGALGLDVLALHPRRASIHPLRSLPTPTSDLAGAWFAVAGDPLAAEVVADLDGRLVEVDDEARTAYHAAAVVASNHLVALLGSVERIAAAAGVPLEAFLDLVRGTVDNVELLGPAAALTGPVARGDWDTVARHLEAIPASEREAYEVLAKGAARLAAADLPVSWSLSAADPAFVAPSGDQKGPANSEGGA